MSIIVYPIKIPDSSGGSPIVVNNIVENVTPKQITTIELTGLFYFSSSGGKLAPFNIKQVATAVEPRGW